jgi:hypothetical protein
MRSAKMYFTMKSNATPRRSSLEKAKANGFLSREFNPVQHVNSPRRWEITFILLYVLSNIFYTFYSKMPASHAGLSMSIGL